MAISPKEKKETQKILRLFFALSKDAQKHMLNKIMSKPKCKGGELNISL